CARDQYYGSSYDAMDYW
nr:immunoglobulin heavy chain junction region [Mus musculus]MBK4185267.1 immunoglobulin heavy chain junction region [Mus musculus]MBK4185268.1 immunoglobulin heavy chain junction region [Mus musculus]MBK4185269.1 immunoglobulin heavy chain junction region [Mus musculus]